MAAYFFVEENDAELDNWEWWLHSIQNYALGQ
jgi:hypothetical protein